MTSGHRKGTLYTLQHYFRTFWRGYNTSAWLASSMVAQFIDLGQPLWASSHSSKFSLDRALVYFYDCKCILWMNSFTELIHSEAHIVFSEALTDTKAISNLKLLPPYMVVFHFIPYWLSIFHTVVWSSLHFPSPVNRFSTCAICCAYFHHIFTISIIIIRISSYYNKFLILNKKFKFHCHFLPVQNGSFIIPLNFFIQNAQHLHSFHMLNMQYRVHSISTV